MLPVYDVGIFLSFHFEAIYLKEAIKNYNFHLSLILIGSTAQSSRTASSVYSAKGYTSIYFEKFYKIWFFGLTFC